MRSTFGIRNSLFPSHSAPAQSSTGIYLSFVSGFIDSSQPLISRASAEVDTKAKPPANKPGKEILNQPKNHLIAFPFFDKTLTVRSRRCILQGKKDLTPHPEIMNGSKSLQPLRNSKSLRLEDAGSCSPRRRSFLERPLSPTMS